MKALTCAATRRRLQAFHDDELPVSEQIAVGAHLEWCDECAASAAELRMLRISLRAVWPGRSALLAPQDSGFAAAVVSRLRAEQTASFSARVSEIFADRHLVYAGLGATVATVACVVIMLTMMRFATIARPDSLAATVRLLASLSEQEHREEAAASSQNAVLPSVPVVIDARMLMPRAMDDAFFAVPVQRAGEAALFTLSAVVTREGRIVNLELLPTGETPAAGSSEARALEGLRGAVSRARFEPARVAGLPVPAAVNMVWMVTHTTVRGTRKTAALDLPPAPAGKKHRVQLEPAPGRLADAVA
jgi:hypothetical protein